MVDSMKCGTLLDSGSTLMHVVGPTFEHLSWAFFRRLPRCLRLGETRATNCTTTSSLIRRVLYSRYLVHTRAQQTAVRICQRSNRCYHIDIPPIVIFPLFPSPVEISCVDVTHVRLLYMMLTSLSFLMLCFVFYPWCSPPVLARTTKVLFTPRMRTTSTATMVRVRAREGTTAPG